MAATPTGAEWLVLGGGGDGSDQAARGGGERQRRGDDDRRGDGDEVWQQRATVLIRGDAQGRRHGPACRSPRANAVTSIDIGELNARYSDSKNRPNVWQVHLVGLITQSIHSVNS